MGTATTKGYRDYDLNLLRQQWLIGPLAGHRGCWRTYDETLSKRANGDRIWRSGEGLKTHCGSESCLHGEPWGCSEQNRRARAATMQFLMDEWAGALGCGMLAAVKAIRYPNRGGPSTRSTSLNSATALNAHFKRRDEGRKELRKAEALLEELIESASADTQPESKELERARKNVDRLRRRYDKLRLKPLTRVRSPGNPLTASSALVTDATQALRTRTYLVLHEYMAPRGMPLRDVLARGQRLFDRTYQKGYWSNPKRTHRVVGTANTTDVSRDQQGRWLYRRWVALFVDGADHDALVEKLATTLHRSWAALGEEAERLMSNGPHLIEPWVTRYAAALMAGHDLDREMRRHRSYVASGNAPRSVQIDLGSAETLAALFHGKHHTLNGADGAFRRYGDDLAAQIAVDDLRAEQEGSDERRGLWIDDDGHFIVRAQPREETVRGGKTVRRVSGPPRILYRLNKQLLPAAARPFVEYAVAMFGETMWQAVKARSSSESASKWNELAAETKTRAKLLDFPFIFDPVKERAKRQAGKKLWEFEVAEWDDPARRQDPAPNKQ